MASKNKKQQKEEPKVVEQVIEKVEEPTIEIDPKIQTMLSLNKKSKLNEKDKQSQIYSAMANIQVERR